MNEKIREILNYFEQINTIPRCSRQEAAISKWLMNWAKTSGFAVHGDPAGNLVIRVPAAAGYEKAPVIVIQGHMDMVCEKTPDSDHDFSTDPIRMITDGDWVTADRTSLGADNGIALAIAMAIAADRSGQHPPLELLFTVDEETGLNGAKKIPEDFFDGRIFLNIDSETEGVFTVGCAGGRDLRLVLPFETTAIRQTETPMEIAVRGLRGGHSGIDIHRLRANANVLMARLLHALQHLEVRLIAAEGGSVHNAIARDARAVIACETSKCADVPGMVDTFAQIARQEFARTEPAMQITVGRSEAASSEIRALSVQDTRKAVQLLSALPHGVGGMSPDVAGLVETSNNLATAALDRGTLKILTSQRSASPSKLDEICEKISAVAALAGAAVDMVNEHPPWPPDMDAPLLARCRAVYEGLFHKPPVVEVIHAGLECAVIGAKFEDIDMISFGPDLENPHSPDERLYVPSLEKIWDFIVALLRSYRPKA